MKRLTVALAAVLTLGLAAPAHADPPVTDKRCDWTGVVHAVRHYELAEARGNDRHADRDWAKYLNRLGRCAGNPRHS